MTRLRFTLPLMCAVALLMVSTTTAQDTQGNFWADWPQASKEAADKTYDQYGKPSGATPTRVIWEDVGPWKTIVVYKDPVPHNFPKPHKDVLEQSVNYQVPTDKFDDLAEFDGSVFAKRTSGVLGTTCDKEPMNILTLNLAHDIIEGKKSVEEARAAFGEIAKAFMSGKKDPYTQRLQFDTDTKSSGDPGEAILKK